MAYSELGDYLFVSMDETNLVGSIYYTNGRMRLVHKHGPTISLLDGRLIMYVLTSEQSWEPFEEVIDKSPQEVIDSLYVKKGKPYQILSFSTREILDKLNTETLTHEVDINTFLPQLPLYLREYFFNNISAPKVIGYHPSRGGAIHLPLNQYDRCFWDIYDIANERKSTSAAVKRSNLATYGAFEAFYNRRGKPFDIHSPYEYPYR